MFDHGDGLSFHYVHSVLRERIVEHLFIGEALRRLWQRGVTDVEVLRSEFDAGGYDVVMTRGRLARHIQFKSIMAGGKARGTSISKKLAEKPSGCVIWIVVSSTLELQSYLYFGGDPGEPLGDLSIYKQAKFAKGNAQGFKAEKPGHHIVPRKMFKVHQDLDAVLDRLFDGLPPRSGAGKVPTVFSDDL